MHVIVHVTLLKYILLLFGGFNLLLNRLKCREDRRNHRMLALLILLVVRN